MISWLIHESRWLGFTTTHLRRFQKCALVLLHLLAFYSYRALYMHLPVAVDTITTTLEQESNMGLFDYMHQWQLRHERLKTTIHEAWRVPLPRWGRVVMGCLYFSLPVMGGWHVMQWAIGKSHDSIGRDGEYLPVKTVQGIGDKVVLVEPDGRQAVTHVGAGGWGGGVNLAVSDEETQKHNRKMLHRFLRQQRKRQQQQQQQLDDAPKEKEP